MRSRRIAAGTVLLIALVAGGCASRRASTPPPEQTGDQPAAVGVVMREFEFEPRPLKAKAGTVRFLLMNRGTVEHDFAIPSLEGHNAHEQHLVKPGQTRTIDLELKPGTYEAICTIPGHREAGMVVKIEVNP